MSSEMIERVAKAMEPETFALPRINLNREVYERAYRRARAAIEAMREPIDEMVSAGNDVDDDASMGWARPEFVWPAMIDAALAAPPVGET